MSTMFRNGIITADNQQKPKPDEPKHGYWLDPVDPKVKDLGEFLDQTLTNTQVLYKPDATYGIWERRYRSCKKMTRCYEVDFVRVSDKYWYDFLLPALIKYAKKWNCGLLCRKHKVFWLVTFYIENHPFDVIIKT